MMQDLLNWVFGLANICLGAFLTFLYQAHKEFRDADKELADKVAKIEILVAGKYVTREEFNATMQRIMDKLERIEAKIQK